MRNPIIFATIVPVLLLLVSAAAMAERGTQVSVKEGTYRSISAARGLPP